jgi:hypothetical protein
MFSAAFFFTACLQIDLTEAEPLSHQTIIAELEKTTDGQQTRTCVDVNNTSTSFIGLLWQNNDKIGVYSQDGSARNIEFTNTADRNVPQTEFSGEITGTPYYAYYPYSTDNANVIMTAVKGNVLAEQPFDPESGTLICDYKYGVRVADGNNTFKFKQLFTMLRITIDASDTGLEGERLNDIVLKVTDASGEGRPICGDFTFNLINGEWKAGASTSNKVSMPWTTRPVLSNDKTYIGFITMMPVVEKTDKISIEVSTDGHKASFTAGCKVDFQSGYFYDIPLKLKDYKNSDKFGYKEETITRPSITEFKFEISKNDKKLINNQLVWNSSKHTPSFSDLTNYSLNAIIDNARDEITLVIPYLYDFKLKPTFTLSGGTSVTAKVNGVVQKSGETEVDFTHPVTYSVVNGEGRTRDYTVKIKNTGLPVVVIEQSNSGSFDKETKTIRTGTLSWDEITVNEFVNFMIRAKDKDWVEDDKITVYNPDGTINCSVDCGVRQRGNTSKDYPKKALAVKLVEKKSVLGMPEHKRWVLLANWLDHSMIRNAVAFDIAHAIEYAWRNSGGAIGAGIPWNVHGQSVELVFVANGTPHHVGNYYLCEQIKIDENRLPIAKPYDIEKPGASDYTLYGHLLEVDGNYDEKSQFKTSKEVPFMFKDEVSSQILSDVKTRVQTIENNIYNGKFADAYKELDINSVVDQMLIFELAMNREYGDPRSVYMFMDGSGKLSGGPVWDFDRGTFQNQEKAKDLGNSTSYRIKPDGEWMFWRTQEDETCSYVWYKKLAEDPIFQQTVKERWTVIKPYLDKIPDVIISYGESLALSYEYNSVMWPTNTSDIKKYKYDFKDWSGDEQLGANGNYQEVINNLVTVYQERLAGMDALIQQGKFTK